MTADEEATRRRLSRRGTDIEYQLRTLAEGGFFTEYEAELDATFKILEALIQRGRREGRFIT